jgi:hypothetical protein
MNKTNNTWDNSEILDFEKDIGFVYCITEKDTGMKYFGIKTIYNVKKLPALKGRTKKEKERRAKLKGNKRHVKKETNWRTYNSSNEELQEKISNNPENYKKEILRGCSTITDMKAYEAYLQLNEYLFGDWNSVYNECINLRLRIRKKH